MDNLQSPDFPLKLHVKKASNQVLKIKLQTLISAKGMSQADFYKSLGLTRQFWYRISYGLDECPLDLKVRIAQALGVDSAVIWQGVSNE